MNYFGTEFNTAGHYIFELEDDCMRRLGINFNDLPFNPEGLTNNLPKGETVFYQGGGFTVIGISGSCYDTRGGTKSIFWVKKILTFGELKKEILNTPISKKIIDSMPFKVRWQSLTNQEEGK